MFIFRHGSKRAAVAVPSIRSAQSGRRSYALERTQIKIPNAPRPAPPFPVVDSCPSPTCQCREMPKGLEIEREQSLNGSMAAYAEQVLISTGKSDWKSRIEDEEGVHGDTVRGLKGLLGPEGKFSDPYHNVLLTASSFPPTPAADQASSSSAFLLPSFTYVPNLPTHDPATFEKLVKAFILPSQLHQSHNALSREQQNALKRQPELRKQFPEARQIDEILILICGHGGRDDRCGTLGPILQSEFEDKLQRFNVPILTGAPGQQAPEQSPASGTYQPSARIGLISHIGGHKWAGNVIIYIPHSWTGHSLVGKGIWYGRVEPRSVEGIVEKTVMEGKVIAELFRGGIDGERNLLRL